jgi:flavin reductase (DIM6/NTAB) family NADH-FMN oxidoreductase RutF
MKKSCGAPEFPCLIPKPCYLVGCCDDNGVASFVTVTNLSGGWMGKIPILLVCLNPGYTQKLIEHKKVFSANMATIDMIDNANFCGFNSGRDVNKGARISHTMGEKLPVPVIDNSPMTFECSVKKIVREDTVLIFLSAIDNFQIEETLKDSFHGVLAGNTLDAAVLNPIISCLGGYYRIGKKAGDCIKP